ncbi:hypothetical protein [Sphingobacterium pedocola]|uniref:Uncharacterized protein n=1 Tax=Sphingobacterium pedocola TaxID=2082722 RepID=A0ABR9T3M4_9SPHI|nr:hypothetical protein [Sphingobacterium pedocola]MBE8719644.1 hypothetical protein [Sphingobacterium pedocola]
MLSQSFINDLWNKSSGSETTWTNEGGGSFSDGMGIKFREGKQISKRPVIRIAPKTFTGDKKYEK